MPTAVYIIIALAVAVIFGGGFVLIAVRSKKRHKEKSALNKVQIGMTEAELYNLLGTPKKSFNLDETAKVLTYCETAYSMLWLIATELEAQISIKNGVVTNISIN